MNFPVVALLKTVGLSRASDTATLRIKISGTDNREGVVSVALFNSAATFLREPFRSIDVPIAADRSVTASFEELPYGEYAISAIHDENNNRKLDTGFLRMPRERFAFSNNAKARMGPARYESARFQIRDNDVFMAMAFN